MQSDLSLVEVETNQTEQVLLNLLVNAGQALPGGGVISVNSELNKGTIFTILLPTTDKKTPAESKTIQTVEKGSETILLVDDEPIIIEIGREILAVLGYNVLTAA